MMDWTDRNCRAFHRHLTRRALLYTEMVTADAVIRGDRERLLGFDPLEQPVALQLGGSEPEKLAEAARVGAARGYVEINLNVGCPSERVQSGAFGACLMREPELVADCLSAMREAVSVPVTVKHRLGVDDDEPRDAAVLVCRSSGEGRDDDVHRPCAQGLAEGLVAEGKPRAAAAGLRDRRRAEARAAAISRSSSMAASPTSMSAETGARRASMA